MGDSFGEKSLMTDSPFSVTAIAREKIDVMVLEKEVFARRSERRRRRARTGKRWTRWEDCAFSVIGLRLGLKEATRRAEWMNGGCGGESRVAETRRRRASRASRWKRRFLAHDSRGVGRFGG